MFCVALIYRIHIPNVTSILTNSHLCNVNKYAHMSCAEIYFGFCTLNTKGIIGKFRQKVSIKVKNEKQNFIYSYFVYCCFVINRKD